jgi:hypothetical protein
VPPTATAVPPTPIATIPATVLPPTVTPGDETPTEVPPTNTPQTPDSPNPTVPVVAFPNTGGGTATSSSYAMTLGFLGLLVLVVSVLAAYFVRRRA